MSAFSRLIAADGQISTSAYSLELTKIFKDENKPGRRRDPDAVEGEWPLVELTAGRARCSGVF